MRRDEPHLTRRPLVGRPGAYGERATHVGRTAYRPSADGQAVPAGATPRIALRLPTVLPAPRWTAFAVAAALTFAVLGIRTTILPSEVVGRATAVIDAMLVRNGVRDALEPGEFVRAGDEIRTAGDGMVTLDLGESRLRLAGETVVRLERAGGGTVELAQLAGRAWHRVGPNVAAYVVVTGDVRWEAHGTAFDLLRTGAAGDDVAEVLVVEHAVLADGPGLVTTVREGRTLAVQLATPSLDATARRVDPEALDDPWLLSNARFDRALGFGIGILAPALAAEDGSVTIP